MFHMENRSFRASNGDGARGAVPAIARAARVLDELAGGPAGVSEIARRTGLGKSSVHALLGSLVGEGLAMRDATGGYALGPRLAELGSRARDNGVIEAPAPSLARLREETGETVLLGRARGPGVAVLARSESTRSQALSAPIGSSVPLLAGALGSAFLATFDPVQAETFLAGRQLPPYTNRSVTEPREYLDRADAARVQGYSVERGEYLPGVAAAASAFRWMDAVYLVWLIAFDGNRSDEDVDAMGQAVCRTAARLHHDLRAGYTGGPEWTE